jgi:hypothetical protein
MPHPTMNKRISRYKYQSWLVPGWFTLTDHEMFVAINTIQEKFAISGNLLEIGTFVVSLEHFFHYSHHLRRQ